MAPLLGCSQGPIQQRMSSAEFPAGAQGLTQRKPPPYSCPPPPLLSDMSRPSTSSTAEKAPRNVLWGGELNQEKRTCTFRPQVERKENCRLLLSAICLGEKAKEEVNRVEILPSGNQEDKKTQPITIASLKASVLPMVTMTGVELSPPVTFQLRAGSGPVFLSGQEYYETSDLPWEEEEEEEGEEEEEEEEEEDDDDDDAEASLEETPVKQVKRPALQKQMSIAKKKKLEKEEEEAVRFSLSEKSPVRKAKPPVRPKKLGSKK